MNTFYKNAKIATEIMYNMFYCNNCTSDDMSQIIKLLSTSNVDLLRLFIDDIYLGEVYDEYGNYMNQEILNKGEVDSTWLRKCLQNKYKCCQDIPDDVKQNTIDGFVNKSHSIYSNAISD